MDVNQILSWLPFVFGGLFILTVGIALLVALARGMTKSRIRGIIFLICLILALVLTVAIKSGNVVAYSALEDTVKQSLTSDEAMEVYQMISGSEPLRETVVGFAVALVAPLLFFIIFLALRIATWIIYFIVMLIVGGKMKENDSHKTLHNLRAVAWGALQGLLIFFVFMTPIYAYLSIAVPAMEVATEQQSVSDENTETVAVRTEQSGSFVSVQTNSGAVLARVGLVPSAMNEQIDMVAIKQTLESLQGSFFFSTYEKLGGNLTCDILTTFTTNGEKTTVLKETKVISSFAAEAMKLRSLNGVESIDEKTAIVIENLAKKFGDSKMMQTIVGEVVYAATDAWKNDRAFFGIEKPVLDPIIAPAFDEVLETFRKDARTPGQLSADITTLGEMVGIVAKSDALKELAGENSDPEQLIETLAQGTLIKDLITVLGKNATLKGLISELANIGMRAIGTTILNLPENTAEIYAQYIDYIVEAINEVLAANLTDEEKVDALAAKMMQAWNDFGLEVELDESIAKLYADALLTEIKNANLSQISADDVKEFFEIYGSMVEEEIENLQDHSAPLAATVKRADEKVYKSTLYGGKTMEQLKESAVAKLANVTKEIAKASTEAQNEEEFREKIEQIKDKYSVTVELKNISQESFTSESLNAASSIKEDSFPTVIVTVQDLLIDTKKVNEQLNEITIEAEAEKIGSIFQTAVKVKDAFVDSAEEFNLDKLGEIASDLGGILDSLDSTETFDGKTALVLTAVFQKEEVTVNMDIDIRTATKIAQAATEQVGNAEVNYGATIESISTGAAIAQKLNDEDAKITEEEIEDLLRSMTPQTANMLKVYMTAERMTRFGIPQKASSPAARLLKALFEEMADKEKYPDYKTETSAMLKMFEIAKAATKHSGYANVFNHGDTVGILNLTAKETVETVMASHMTRNAVVAAMFTNGEIDPEMVNPFGLKIPTDGSDYQDCEAAIEEYYGLHPESKTFLKAVAALFGIEATFLN